MVKVWLTQKTASMVKFHQRPNENIHQTVKRLLSEKVAVEHRCPDEFVWFGRLTMMERVDAIELKSGDVEVSIPFLGEIR